MSHVRATDRTNRTDHERATDRTDDADDMEVITCARVAKIRNEAAASRRISMREYAGRGGLRQSVLTVESVAENVFGACHSLRSFARSVGETEACLLEQRLVRADIHEIPVVDFDDSPWVDQALEPARVTDMTDDRKRPPFADGAVNLVDVRCVAIQRRRPPLDDTLSRSILIRRP